MNLTRTQPSPNTVHYAATSLSGANPSKYLTTDSRGYTKVILGAFNMPNKSGIVYPFLPQVEKLFQPGSAFHNKLLARELKGECGHPLPYGMTLQQFLLRLQKIEPTLVAVHINELELVETKTDKGLPIILVWGWVIGSGPYGPSLDKQLANKEENVAFSLRSLTDPVMIDGRMCKVVWDMITYDLVSSGGIIYAEKSNSIMLDGTDMKTRINISCGLEEVGPETYFTPQDFNEAIRATSAAGLENDASTLAMVRDGLGWTKVQVTNLSALAWRGSGRRV